MKIQFENVDFFSTSGPNGFGLKLARQLLNDGHKLTNSDPDVRLSFIQSMNDFSPTVLRLDGIWFNSEQDWKRQNEPIKRSFDHANAVIVQSEFDKELVSRFFGERDNVKVIHNGTDIKAVASIPPANTGIPREKVWMCASSWRPHKRLYENVRLFKEHAGPDHIMFIAGKDAEKYLTNDDLRIRIMGDLTWEQMISYMKASKNFIHLAWLDHCPNVVVDARAAGCHIWCSSAGGTVEIAGKDSTVVVEEDWDFSPVRLYDPPRLKFDNIVGGTKDSNINIAEVSLSYLACLGDVSKNANE